MLPPPSIILYGFSIEYILSLEYLRNSEYNRRKTPRRYLGMKMKKLIKAVALSLCLTMAVPVVAPSVGIETVEAAEKVKLNCTKKTIKKGDSIKLKVTGTNKKVKWQWKRHFFGSCRAFYPCSVFFLESIQGDKAYFV